MPDVNPGEDRLGPHGDAFYEMLMEAHLGLAEDESHALNARLVLLMANRIGDLETLEKILKSAGTNRD